MRQRTHWPCITPILFIAFTSLPTFAEPVGVRVDTDKPSHRISRYIYGQFIEHLGGCIYDGIWVGEDSPIANRRGLRLDTLDALKQIKVPVMRWPGGLFADHYHWCDGIGPRNKRPITQNRGWNQTESNQFGTHEFMDFCKQIGAEPYLCLNIGSGTVEEARAWAEYCNSEMDTTLTRERAANGHPEPFGVKFWSLGNEPYYALDGMMTSQYYWDRARHFAGYVKHAASNATLRSEPQFDSVKLFLADGRVLKDIEVQRKSVLDYFDLLAVHNYVGRRFPEPNLSAVQKYERIIANTAKLRGQLQSMCKMATELSTPRHSIDVALDEWGVWREEALPQTGNVQEGYHGDAIYSAALLHMLNEHDKVYMANLAQTCNVLACLIKTDGPQFYRTPLYHVFEMFVPFQDATHLPVQVADDRKLQMPGGIELDRMSVSAAMTQSGTLFISLINWQHDTATDVALNIDGSRAWRATAVRRLAAPSVDSVNSFERPNVITAQNLNVEEIGVDRTITLPPLSVTTIQFE